MIKSESISKTEAVNLTPDGGIIKIPIVTPKNIPKPNWTKGCNALFHYSVHAYVIPRKHEEHVHTANCSHNHHHNHADGNGNASQMEQKVANFKALIESMKDKKKPKVEPLNESHAKSDGDSHAKDADPDAKPERKKVSDSRELDTKPFELRIGYSFSVQCMEICVKSMVVGERSRFLCTPQYTQGFAQLETVLRQQKLNEARMLAGQQPISFGGCCATASEEALAIHRDVEEFYGCPLEFEIELLQVKMPDSFVREPWELSTNEKYLEVPKCKDEGTALFKKGDYREARGKYERALAMLEALANSGIALDLKKDRFDREKALKAGNTYDGESLIPADNIVELQVIESLTEQCRLNHAACQLKLEEYASVVEQCSKVLALNPKSVKAYFRRAQAYTAVGRDLDLAQQDLDKLKDLVPQNTPEWTHLMKERQTLDLKLKQHESKEKKMYGGMFN